MKDLDIMLLRGFNFIVQYALKLGGICPKFKNSKAITCGAQHKYYANIIMVKPYNCYDDLNVIN